MSSFRQQVSSSIRILGWNRDASARATHLKAADGNVPFATIERKSMSTKTSIKRAALVAVAALTLGGISAVSASATTVPGLLASKATGATSVTASTTYPQDTVGVTATVGSYVLETVTAVAADKVYTITTTGGTISIATPSGTLYPAASDTGTQTQYTATSTGVNWYTGNAPGIGGAFNGQTLVFAVYSATAGTQTLTITGNSSAAVTQTITWGAAPAISVGNSSAVLVEGTSGIATSTGATDVAIGASAIANGFVDSSTAEPTTASSGVAAITVLLKDNEAPTAAVIAGDSLTAVVTGNGLVAGTNGPTDAGYTYGQYGVSASSTTSAAGTAVWKVSSNGGSGVATITISYTSSTGVNTVIATKTITFYSSTITSIKATVNHQYIPAAAVAGYVYAGGADVSASGLVKLSLSTTNLPAVSVVAKDANGNAIPGADGSASTAITVTSSNNLVATVALNPNYNAALGVYYPVISPVAEGTVTLTFADASTGAVTATAVVNVSKAVISSVATATDASSYDPATPVKYTVTAKDAAGNAVPDGTYAGFYLAGYEPTVNIAMQNFPTAATFDTLTTTSGVDLNTFYAPVTPGTSVTITGGTLPGTAGSATAGAAIFAASLNGSTQGGASFTVNGGSDASGATDAANAATDAANAAADAADNATQAASEALAAVNSLATTVASLIAGIKAQITSLTNLITKIKNKVGA